MNQNQRAALATALRRMRIEVFGDNKKAAYVKADVNSATWERLEGAQTVKPTTLSKVVRNLFPETKGDWTRLGLAGDEDERIRELVEGKILPMFGDRVTPAQLSDLADQLLRASIELESGGDGNVDDSGDSAPMTLAARKMPRPPGGSSTDSP